MTDRYRIIQKDTICDDVVMSKTVGDGFDADEAIEALFMFKDTYPNSSFEIEKYNWFPESNRIGRDPDLH